MSETPLERLAGTWEFEPFIDGRSAGKGRATFEWIEDGAVLLERSVAEWTEPGWVENAPKTSQSVVGFDYTTLEAAAHHRPPHSEQVIRHPRAPLNPNSRLTLQGETR